MLKNICFVFFVIILLPSLSFGKVKTIHASHKYIMGDNDSKNDARKMCFIEAKRKALEMAGTYIKSNTEIKNLQLTKDEITIYSSALLKVETVKEEWKFIGENLAVFLTVKAEVDTGYIEGQLTKIKRDSSVQKKITNQQRRLQQLERNVVELQKQLGAVDSTKAATLRKERNVTFKQIDELQELKIAIVTKIKAETKKVIQYVELGMTISEVKSLVGEPRSYYDTLYALGLNYGNVIVLIESGLVSCIIKSTCYGMYSSCAQYRSSSKARNCIIK